MKLIKRILILMFAAWLGSIIYSRYVVIENVMKGVQQQSSAQAEPNKPLMPWNKKLPSKNYQHHDNQFKGGIGPVGNPYEAPTQRRQDH